VPEQFDPLAEERVVVAPQPVRTLQASVPIVIHLVWASKLCEHCGYAAKREDVWHNDVLGAMPDQYLQRITNSSVYLESYTSVNKQNRPIIHSLYSDPSIPICSAYRFLKKSNLTNFDQVCGEKH
jgi:hypothetical protein